MEESTVGENVSICSLGSSNISVPDFEVVDKMDSSPKLNVGNDGDSNDLACELNEILEPLNLDKVMLNSSVHGMRDILKDNSEVVNYSGVTYLGSAAALNPTSLAECHRNIKILREQSKVPIAILLSVPRRPDGIVNLYDPCNHLSILSFGLHRIEFCTRGPDGTAERQCFAFTCRRGSGDAGRTDGYQCHAFSCESLSSAKKIIDSFMETFKQVANSPPSMSNTVASAQSTTHTSTLPAPACDQHPEDAVSSRFRLEVDIGEIDDSSSSSNKPPKCTPVHRDRHVFKLRRHTLKQLTIRVQALQNCFQFRVEKCFGLLLSQGRNVNHSDMTLVEINSMGFENDKIYKIVCNWDPTDPSFKILNTITSKEMRVFFTIAVDLILESVSEPVRFVVESKAKIYPQHEKFWSLSDTTPHHELFSLQFKKIHLEINENSNSSGQMEDGVSKDTALVDSHTVYPDEVVCSSPTDSTTANLNGPPMTPNGATLPLDEEVSCLDVVIPSPQSDDNTDLDQEIGVIPVVNPTTAVTAPTSSCPPLTEQSSPPSQVPPICYSLHSIHSQSQLDRMKASRNLAMTPTKNSSRVHIADAPLEDSDNDEPLLSGSGIVSREISDVTLARWDKTIVEWQTSISKTSQLRPKDVQVMVRHGVPECYRGAVWPLLSNVYMDKDIMEETYRNLCIKESPCEHIIKSDIHRTFPAHNFFKEAGGSGQESLLRICKAYSLYDAEVGYCQGLSFLVAALLLHMPEEQAFCVMVKIMNDYQMRDVYKNGLESLHLCIYQLERLLQDQLPELSSHFVNINLEAHMFASQWFLTLFTAKFPLFMVFHILDLFLSEGSHVIFKVAIALLKYSANDLMKLDFEGALKYFRVNLPKLFKTESAASDFLYSAARININNKKMKRYDKDFRAMRELQLQQEDPVDQLMRLNKAQQDSILRLEQENDDLAHQLVTNKIDLRSQLDMMEDQCENLSSDLVMSKSQIYDSDEERRRLQNELQQLKFICRNELDALEEKDRKNAVIISDYKKIRSELSSRLEAQHTINHRTLANIKGFIVNCDKCSSKLLSPAAANGQPHSTHPRTTPAPHPATSEDRQWSAAVTDPLGAMDSDITDKARRESASNHEQIRELELELAQTKLALVESEVHNQDLTHSLNGLTNKLRDETASNKNSWLSKTLTSIKEKASNSTLPLSPSTPKLLVPIEKH